MSSDVVHQVRIEHASRVLGEGFLVGASFVVTTTAVAHETGLAVSLRVPGDDGAARPGTGDDGAAGTGDDGAAGPGTGDTGVAAPVAAEVVEVLGSQGLALLEVAAPGFVVPLPPAPGAAALRLPDGSTIPAPAVAGRLGSFRRFGAAHLRAELDGRKISGGSGGGGEGSTARIASEQAGGARRTAGMTADGPSSADAGERGVLLLAYLWESARSGRLDPLVTVPALEGSR